MWCLFGWYYYWVLRLIKFGNYCLKIEYWLINLFFNGCMLMLYLLRQMFQEIFIYVRSDRIWEFVLIYGRWRVILLVVKKR